MPSVTTSVAPELFKLIRGVKVFYTYKDDDMDQGANSYWFTLHEDSDEMHFDVRDLDVPARKLLDSHPPLKTSSDPVWANASASERAKIDKEWEAWHTTGKSEVIVKIIDEALAAGLLKLPDAEIPNGDIETLVEITVQVTEVHSNQEWATDPNMVEVSVGAAFLQLAEACVAFMQENDIDYMCKWWASGYTLYKVCDDPDAEERPKIIGVDGQEYVEFQPEYRLNGCNANIYKDGDIRAILPFKHSENELWFEVGNIKDLKFNIESKPESTAR